MHMINWFVIHVSGAKGDDFTYLTKTQMSDKKRSTKMSHGKAEGGGKKRKKKSVIAMCCRGSGVTTGAGVSQDRLLGCERKADHSACPSHRTKTREI